MSQSIGQSSPQLRPLDGPPPTGPQGVSGSLSNIETTSRLASPPPSQQGDDSLALTIDGQHQPHSSGHIPPPLSGPSSSGENGYGVMIPATGHDASSEVPNQTYHVMIPATGHHDEAEANDDPPYQADQGTYPMPVVQGGSASVQAKVGTGEPEKLTPPKILAQATSAKPLMTRQAFKQNTEMKPRFWPHQDRAYKDVLGKIQAFDKFANAQNVSPKAADRQAMFKGAMRALDGVEASVRKFASTDGRATGSVTTLLAQVNVTRKALLTLSSDQSIAWDKVNGGRPMTAKQATELVRLGITPGPDTRFEPGHGDTKVKGGLDDFAHGMNNVVARLNYANGDERILKPETGQRGTWATEITMGIPEKNPAYAARSLATSVVDGILGTNVIPKTSLAIHNGGLNLSMEVASGRLGARPWINQPVTGTTRNELWQMKKDFAPQRFAQELDKREIKEIPGKSPAEFQFIGKFATNIDPRDPALMQQMNKLEWLDCITGQADRHTSNMIVEFAADRSFVGLKGIDNDTAFGKNWHDMDDVAATKDDTNQYRGNGLPSFVDADVAHTLTDPGTWRDLSTRLSKLLSPEEMLATKDRFDLAVAKVNLLAQGNGVVNDWHAMAPTVQADAKNSYAKTFANVQSGFQGVPDPYAKRDSFVDDGSYVNRPNSGDVAFVDDGSYANRPNSDNVTLSTGYNTMPDDFGTMPDDFDNVVPISAERPRTSANVTLPTNYATMPVEEEPYVFREN